jgi:ABC-type transport system involved in multi-copper enzyme maturation permease subunit
MSISPPRYTAAPFERMGRLARVRTIWRHEVGALAGWGTWLVVAIIYLAVVIIVVLNVAAESFIGNVTLATFFAPYASPAWPYLVLIVATAVGSGCIADDLGSRSITLYLSRPISHTDYLVGKAGAVGFWIAVAAIGPGLVGVTLSALLGYASGPIAAQAFGAFLGIGLLTSAFFTALGVFISALTTRALYAGAGIFGTVLCAEILGDAIGGATGNVPVQYLDPIGDLLAAAGSVFATGATPTVAPATAALLLVAEAVILLVLADLLLERVEVVGE